MKLILAAVIAAALVLPLSAEEKPAVPAKSGWSDFFKNLKSTLAQSAVGGERKRARGAQGVAAVRGKKQKGMADPNEPSLMGDVRSAKAKKEAALDAEFEVSVDRIQSGKAAEALKGFEDFKAAHPKYRPEDVDKAIEGAKAMIAEQGGAAARE